MKASDFETLTNIADRNEDIREDLSEVLHRYACDYIHKKTLHANQRKGPFVHTAQEWRGKTDIEEGKMHDLLGVSDDQKIMDAYDDPTQLAEDLVDEVGQQSAVGMLAVPLAAGGDVEDFYQDAIDHIEEEIPNK
mgnify:CR=1 FL=1